MAVEGQEAERNRRSQARLLPRLRSRQVAQLPLPNRAGDETANGHGPGPTDRLSRDPAPGNDDGPGTADVQGTGPQVTVHKSRQVQVAAGRFAGGDRTRQGRAGYLQRHFHSTARLANDAGDGRLHYLVLLPRRGAQRPLVSKSSVPP